MSEPGWSPARLWDLRAGPRLRSAWLDPHRADLKLGPARLVAKPACSNDEPLIYLYISTLRSTTYLVILYLYLQLFVSTYVPITIFYESNSTNRQIVTT